MQFTTTRLFLIMTISCLVSGGIASSASAQEESLDEWMSRVTGEDYSKTQFKDPESVAKVKPSARPTRSETRTSDAPKSSGSSGDGSIYFRFNAGANIASDAKIDDVSISYLSGGTTVDEGFSGVKLDLNTGLDLNVGLGFDIDEAWAIEVSSGIAYNSIGGASGDYFFDDPAVGYSEVATVTGASGDLYQIPVVADVRYRFDLGETMSIGLLAGVGVQYTHAKIDSISGNAMDNQGGSVAGKVLLSINENAWAFRYQFGVNFGWQIAPNTDLGLYARYSATTSNKFATIGPVDITVKSFQNVALGGFLSFRF